MEAIEQLKDDLREGRIDADRLVDLIVALRGQLQASQQRIAELEKQLAGSGTAKVDEPYSLKAEEKRQEEAQEAPERPTWPYHHGRESETGRTHGRCVSRRSGQERMPVVAHAASLAVGGRSRRTDRLQHLPRSVAVLSMRRG